MKKLTFTILFFLMILSGRLEKTCAQTATPTPNCCQGVTALANEGAGFNSPMGMAIDYGRDRLYVVESINKQLMVYTANGSPVTAVSSWPTSQFAGPMDVSVDGQGNVFVADSAVVDKFDKDLNFVTSFGADAGSFFRGVWVDGQSGSVYLTTGSNYIYRYDGSGSIYSMATSFGGSATLNAPTGLVKVGNSLYVADTNNSRVVKFDLGNSNAATVMATGINAYGIRTDLAGYFYVSSLSLQILDVFRPDFTLDHFCTLGGGPWGMAVNTAGEIFLSENSTGSVTVVQGCIVEPTPTPSYNGSNPPDAGQFFIYPSPARGDHATLSYNMAGSGQIDLKIWNEKAELVAHVTDQKPAGVQVTPFSISGFATGIYFYALTINYDSGRNEQIKPQKFAIIH
ncbi:MAG TPA: NHL repeat-containing protein [bacterium]